MATFTHLDRGYAFSNPLNTASLTADNPCSLLISVEDFQGTGAPSISGCGMTWSLVEGPTALDGDIDLYTFSGVGTMTTGVLTISGGGGSAFAYVVTKVTAHNASAPIIQSNDASGASNAPSVTLGAFESASNSVYAVYAAANAGAITEGSGFTELFDGLAMFDGGTFYTEYSTNDTTADLSTALSTDWAMHAIELDESGGGGGGAGTATIAWLRA